MIICETCIRVYDGTRADARRAAWEPRSTTTQWDLDHGPMVCPQCIADLLAEVMRLMRTPRGMR